MSAEIINLRQARKRRDRATRTAEAAGNRAKHGRTKAERNQTHKTAEREARRLDGHRLDKPLSGDDEGGSGT